jgi:hypothetical protein
MTLEIRTNIVRTPDGQQRHEIYRGDRHLGTVIRLDGTPPTWVYRVGACESTGYVDSEAAAFALLESYRRQGV